MSEQIYKVDGMTCPHCVAAVTGEVLGVPGAERVDVELATGALTVRGERVDATAVRAAVEEAGYRLA